MSRIDDFPLDRFWRAARASRRQLLLLIAAGAAAGAAWALIRTPMYEANVTLLVRQTVRIGIVNAERPTIADYPTLLANRMMADRLAKEHDLARWGIDAEKLLSLVRIREVRGTSLLHLSVTLPDPTLAVRVAQGFADGAVKFNRDLNAQDVVATLEVVKSQLDEALRRLDVSEEALLEHRTRAQVDVRRADTKAQLEARERLITLTSELQAERGRLAVLEKQTASVPRTATGASDLPVTSDLVEQARQFEETGDLPTWPVSADRPGAIRQLLAYQTAAARARVASMEARLRELVGRRKLEASSLPGLTGLYAAEVRLVRLELDREIAAKAVSELSAQYEQARLQVASRVADLQVVDRAALLNSQVAPGVALLVVLGMVIGLAAGVVMVTVRAFAGPRNSMPAG